MQHLRIQTKNNSILSKDGVTARRAGTEQRADIRVCTGVLPSPHPGGGHRAAPRVSQRHRLSTMLLKLLGEPAGRAHCTARTENKNSRRGGAEGAAFLSSSSQARGNKLFSELRASEEAQTNHGWVRVVQSQTLVILWIDISRTVYLKTV